MATRGEESNRGRGISAIVAVGLFREGMEEAPREMQEKEETTCKSKGEVEKRTGEKCIPDEATSSIGDAEGDWELFSGYTESKPMPGDFPPSDSPALLEPDGTFAELRHPPSSLDVK